MLRLWLLYIKKNVGLFFHVSITPFIKVWNLKGVSKGTKKNSLQLDPDSVHFVIFWSVDWSWKKMCRFENDTSDKIE